MSELDIYEYFKLFTYITVPKNFVVEEGNKIKYFEGTGEEEN